jgi:hypothetical protein
VLSRNGSVTLCDICSSCSSWFNYDANGSTHALAIDYTLDTCVLSTDTQVLPSLVHTEQPQAFTSILFAPKAEASFEELLAAVDKCPTVLLYGTI